MDLLDEGLAVQRIEAALILPLGEHGLTAVALDEGGAVAADAERLMLAEAALAVGEPQPALPLEEAVVGGAGHVRQRQHLRLEAQGQGNLLLHWGGVGLIDLGAVGGEPALLHGDGLIRVHLGEAAGIQRILHHGGQRRFIQGFRVGDADPTLFYQPNADLLAAGDLVFAELALVSLEGEGLVLVGDDVRLGTEVGDLVQQTGE